MLLKIPVGEGLVPLDDYYLWCDHRAKQEAALITELARIAKLQAIEWCGGDVLAGGRSTENLRRTVLSVPTDLFLLREAGCAG